MRRRRRHQPLGDSLTNVHRPGRHSAAHALAAIGFPRLLCLFDGWAQFDKLGLLRQLGAIDRDGPFA